MIQTVDYDSNGSYFVAAIEADITSDERYITLVNTKGEIIKEYLLHPDISNSYFEVNEDETMSNGTYIKLI